MLLFIIQIILFCTDCLFPIHNFTLHVLKAGPTILPSSSFTLEKASILMKLSIVWDGHSKHYTHGGYSCMIGKESLQTASIVQEKKFYWPSVRISATMEFAIKGMFLCCPDTSKTR
jgi:hypothetical protein